MTELTPELEALYALHRNVPRSELSMAAQLEYDRLRAAWEQGEARPAAGELEATRLAWEHEYSARHDSGPAIQHAVDRSGTTRTFRYRRVFHMVLGTLSWSSASATSSGMRRHWHTRRAPGPGEMGALVRGTASGWPLWPSW